MLATPMLQARPVHVIRPDSVFPVNHGGGNVLGVWYTIMYDRFWIFAAQAGVRIGGKAWLYPVFDIGGNAID